MKIQPVPRSLNWNPTLPQTHICDRGTLLTSGCSFTMPFLTEGPDTWPGFLKDRCGFKQTIDYSWTGLVNQYIKESIIYHLDNVADFSDIFVAVVWTGLNREFIKIAEPTSLQLDPAMHPKLGDTYYVRTGALSSDDNTFSKEHKQTMAAESAQHIFELRDYLEERNIPFVFSTYVNLLYPPFIPKRDQTHHYYGHVDKDTLNKLKEAITIPSNPMDHLYEFGFVHDMLYDDMFHPNATCAKHWVDSVLLPGLTAQGKIRKI